MKFLELVAKVLEVCDDATLDFARKEVQRSHGFLLPGLHLLLLFNSSCKKRYAEVEHQGLTLGLFEGGLDVQRGGAKAPVL